MTFKIHVTHRHVEGAGLHNEYYESVEPCDEELDIEVEDEQVHNDLVKIMLDECLARPMPQPIYELLQTVVTQIIDDNELWDELVENYHDDLRLMYEEIENE